MNSINIISNIGLITLIAVSAFFYKHADQKYKEGKASKIKSAPYFSAVYRWIQITSLVGIGLSLFDSGFLRLWQSPSLQIVGISLSVLSISLFVHAKRTLGKNYSPCFDSYVPFQIVEVGVYKFIRHPIYTANILFLLGMLLVTGNLFQVLNLLLLTAYNIESALKEEQSLLKQFGEYRSYYARTGRFLPKF